MRNKDLLLAFVFWGMFTIAVGIAGFFGGIVYEYKSQEVEFICDLNAHIGQVEID